MANAWALDFAGLNNIATVSNPPLCREYDIEFVLDLSDEIQYSALARIFGVTISSANGKINAILRANNINVSKEVPPDHSSIRGTDVEVLIRVFLLNNRTTISLTVDGEFIGQEDFTNRVTRSTDLFVIGRNPLEERNDFSSKAKVKYFKFTGIREDNGEIAVVELRNTTGTSEATWNDISGGGLDAVLSGPFPAGAAKWIPYTYTPSSNNTAPVANAGANQTINANGTANLSGTASSDADGDTLTYLWTLLIAPDGTTVTLANPESSTPTFTTADAGQYVLRLVVNDGTVDSAPSDVTITVQEAAEPTLNMSITGVPDATNYTVDFYVSSTGAQIERRTNVQFISGSASEVIGAVDDSINYVIFTETHIFGDTGVVV